MTMRSVLLSITTVLLVLIVFMNIWSFGRHAINDFPEYSQSEVFKQETRYGPLLQALVAERYPIGSIEFITNRDVHSKPQTPQDYERRVYAQFILLPWGLLSGMCSVSACDPSFKPTTPFVIGDFWDAPLEETPADLIQVRKFGNDLFLFRRRLQ